MAWSLYLRRMRRLLRHDVGFVLMCCNSILMMPRRQLHTRSVKSQIGGACSVLVGLTTSEPQSEAGLVESLRALR